MVPILDLWLPILLAAFLVFLMSSIIHMALRYHANDYRKLPDEAAAAGALRALDLPDGQYALPKAGSMREMSSPEFQAKVRQGPNAMLTIWGGTSPSLTRPLVWWFLYAVVIGVFAAYVAGRALGPGAEYSAVFRFVGVTAFAGYALADVQRSIWWRQPLSVTARNLLDGLLYALLTAGAFGWLWPAG